MTTTYDFHTLSSIDFEELVRDLLQAEWGVPLESFGPGADGGVDLRRIDGPRRTVVQAKHLRASGARALLREMRTERDKAVALGCTRYLLATSVPMRPSRKDAIVSAIADVPLVPSDILGLEDLNNLLARHPEIQRRHFKLWLSSTVVLERILHSGVYNRTAAEMDIVREELPRFVQNRSVSDAEKMLSEAGTLIIAGPPGVGKTTLARVLLWLHAEQGWRVFVVDSLEEAFKVADPAEKRLILLDDFLGQVRLSADHVRGVDARMPPLLSRMAAHNNLRFVLTTRDYILAQARSLSSRLAPDRRTTREHVLNVANYTRAIKARILYNHLYFSSLTDRQRREVLADDYFLKVIDHPNFSPRLIQQVTSGSYLALTDAPIRRTIATVLANPEVLWERPYRQHLGDDARALMIALFLNGRSAGLGALKASYRRASCALGSEPRPGDFEARFRSTFKELDGSVLALNHGSVAFANPGLSDFLQSVIVADRLVPVLLPHLSSSRELRELWDVFERSEPSNAEKRRTAAPWTDALERMRSSGHGDLHDVIKLAADLCAEIDHAPLVELFESALDELEADLFSIGDVPTACSLLEATFCSTLPWSLKNRFRSVVTRAAAALLHDHADDLCLEDIQSLDEALHEYGNDAVLAMRASREAMTSVSRFVAREIDGIDDPEALDAYEEDLLAFMGRRGFPTMGVVLDVERRRERLREQPSQKRSGVYRSSPGVEAEVAVTDGEIRSMFNALRRE